jgi:non-ribosomal peptide synthetase component F
VHTVLQQVYCIARAALRAASRASDSLAADQLAPAVQLGASSNDRVLSLTTICFDIAGLELYLPLLVGGTLVLATREQAMDPEELSNLIKREGPTVMQARGSRGFLARPLCCERAASVNMHSCSGACA